MSRLLCNITKGLLCANRKIRLSSVNRHSSKSSYSFEEVDTSEIPVSTSPLEGQRFRDRF